MEPAKGGDALGAAERPDLNPGALPPADRPPGRAGEPRPLRLVRRCDAQRMPARRLAASQPPIGRHDRIVEAAQPYRDSRFRQPREEQIPGRERADQGIAGVRERQRQDAAAEQVGDLAERDAGFRLAGRLGHDVGAGREAVGGAERSQPGRCVEEPGGMCAEQRCP